MDLLAMAFPKPHDGWKKLKKGRLPHPSEFDNHESMWERIAERLGIKPGAQVIHVAPVIGGRRRYAARPLSTWKLPQNKGQLTLTTDRMEAMSWNRLKSKRHPAMPKIKDVFQVDRSGEPPIWAIHHEELTFPPADDWYLFVDTFFRWRAMAKDALKPAKPQDLAEFMEWIVSPETGDAKAQNRNNTGAVLPFAIKQKREDKIDMVRKRLLMDGTLEKKLKWAKSTLNFLKTASVSHRDLDPSNLGATKRAGRVVVTNIAESRSQGKKTGRIGRVK